MGDLDQGSQAAGTGGDGGAPSTTRTAAVGDCVERLKENTTAMKAEVPEFDVYFEVIETREVYDLADLTGAMVGSMQRGAATRRLWAN